MGRAGLACLGQISLEGASIHLSGMGLALVSPGDHTGGWRGPCIPGDTLLREACFGDDIAWGGGPCGRKGAWASTGLVVGSKSDISTRSKSSPPVLSSCSWAECSHWALVLAASTNPVLQCRALWLPLPPPLCLQAKECGPSPTAWLLLMASCAVQKLREVGLPLHRVGKH